jgi:putative addiction module component (TIGR02574 family)
MNMSEPLSRPSTAELSLAEKIQLVQDIWDEIAAEAEGAALTEPQRQELDRRLAAYRAGEMTGDSWENVKARLRAGSSLARRPAAER